jgi:hypothetical protein
VRHPGTVLCCRIKFAFSPLAQNQKLSTHQATFSNSNTNAFGLPVSAGLILYFQNADDIIVQNNELLVIAINFRGVPTSAFQLAQHKGRPVTGTGGLSKTRMQPSNLHKTLLKLNLLQEKLLKICRAPIHPAFFNEMVIDRDQLNCLNINFNISK